MISSHSMVGSLMDWEPAEGYGMDVDEKTPTEPAYSMTQELFSSENRDVRMAPTAVQEVHMASPISISQPLHLSLPTIDDDCDTFFLPPLKLNTNPIVFPPLIFPALPWQAQEHHVGEQEIETLSLDFSSSCALAVHTMANTDSEDVNDTFAVNIHGLECPVASQNIERAPLGWPGWLVEQDVTPNTTLPIVAEAITPPGWPDWMMDDDTTSISQCLSFESSTSHSWLQTAASQEYVDCGVDLIGLFRPNSDSQNSSEDDFVLRAFGGSSLEELDWILDGFRMINVPDAHIASTSNGFEAINYGTKLVSAPLSNFSPVSPYDWALNVSETGSDLITFGSVHDLCHHPVETALVLPTARLPSFKSEHVTQTQSNTLFQASTPAPCDWSAFVESPLAAPVNLNKMTFFNTAEIVITSDSQSSIDSYPVSDISDTFELQSHSPFNSIYHSGNALTGFSKAAYKVEKNALRKVKAFKSKLSSKVQKLGVRTKTSGFLKFLAPSSQDIRTTTQVSKKNDIHVEHDAFGEVAEVADKRITKPTKVDASTQTDELVHATYGFRSSRQYSRYSPYSRLGRDFPCAWKGYVDLEHDQLVQEESPCSVTSNTSYVLPSPGDSVIFGCSSQGSVISQRELEGGLTVHSNEGELKEVEQEKGMTFPGAYRIEQDDPFTSSTPCVLPSSEENVSVGYSIQGTIAPKRELADGLTVDGELGEVDQEKEMTFPGAYPIDRVVCALNGLPAKDIHALGDFAQVRKKAFEAKVLPCPPVKQSVLSRLEEAFFKFVANLFGC